MGQGFLWLIRPILPRGWNKLVPWKIGRTSRAVGEAELEASEGPVSALPRQQLLRRFWAGGHRKKVYGRREKGESQLALLKGALVSGCCGVE